jgi:GGDEF domain-containing protein
MPPALDRTGVLTNTTRNYWWVSSLGGLYFVGGFVAWGGSRASIVSSALFVVTGVIGLLLHYRLPWRTNGERLAAVVAHLLIGQLIVIWQQRYLPLSDFTASGNPDARMMLTYLVSALIVGTSSMFGGLAAAGLALALHYLFVFNPREEFSFKWAFPILIAAGGTVVSRATWRLDRAYEKLDRLANHDALTGLLNRRKLVEEYERLVAESAADGRTLLLVAWDLDDLKRVNDTQGHAAGDAYICSFSAALAASVRRTTDRRAGDAAFRVGGDEFISLHLGSPGGEALVARVRATCPTVSAGWVPCAGLTLDQALTRADERLYADKAARKAGRPAISA